MPNRSSSATESCLGVILWEAQAQISRDQRMPLDDNEQKILEEIERQFYDEDPELARAVERIERPSRVGVRLSLLGVIVGLVIVIAYVSNTWVALLGFALLVASATSLVGAVRASGWSIPEREVDEETAE